MIEGRREISFSERDPMLDAQIDRHYYAALDSISEFEVDMNLEQFKELYGELAIKSDLKYVKDMEEKFSQDSSPIRDRYKKLATIFESIVDQQIELNDWLGEGVYTVKTSKYDDIRNGVDTVLEFERDEGTTHMALAVDVTFSKDLSKKIKRIQQDIETGRLTQVKYYESADMSFHGKLTDVPRIIIGADLDRIKDLMDLNESDKNVGKEMKFHPARLQFIVMLQMQLESFRDYATKVGQRSVEKIYQKHLDIINGYMEEEGLEMLGRILDGDKVYLELKKQLDKLREE